MTKKKKAPAKKPKPEGYVFGAPTKYDKEYCQKLIDHMGKGFSYESFAGVMGVARATIYNWEKHKDFLDAKTIGMEKNLYFWEKVGIDGATGKTQNFNATAYVWNKKNRFPKDWNDRRDANEDNNRIHTVKIELPESREQQVISMEPKKIEGDDGSS